MSVVEYAGRPADCVAAKAAGSGLSQTDFNRLADFVHKTIGISLASSKRIMVESRLRKRLEEMSMPSFRAYCDYVLGPAGESEIAPLLDRITTNKTDFFREPAHFGFLTTTVLPAMRNLCQSGIRQPLSVWSAGCSTGEEPWTLAMVLGDYAGAQPGGRFRFAITATDISTRVLEKARAGIYDAVHAEPIPHTMRRRFLLRSKDNGPPLVRICPELRPTVQFHRLNLMDADFGFDSPFDTIFCRNVMIYFNRAVQEQLVNRFASNLKPGGYLFVGHSESLNGLDTRLVAVAPSIYRKPS